MENEKQYYRVNDCNWYMVQKGNQYESLTAYKSTAKIEVTKGYCIEYKNDCGCTFEPITEESYNRLRKWVLAKILNNDTQ